MTKVCLTTLLCLLFSPIGKTQNLLPPSTELHFERIGPRQGFYNTYASALVQDADHFLWIGTSDGLYRYDGIRYKEFRHNPNDSTSLSWNDINWLYTDHSGTLWVGTNGGGLDRFEPETQSFTHLQQDPDQPNTLSDNVVRVIVEDSHERLWIGTGNGGLCFLDKKTGLIHPVQLPLREADPELGVRAVIEDRKGRLWIGCNRGIYRWDHPGKHIPKPNEFKAFLHDPHNPNSPGNDYVKAFLEDKSGHIWVGTPGGLNRFDPETEHFTRFVKDPQNAHSLNDNNIECLMQDARGQIWVATNNGGLNLYNPQTQHFQHYVHDSQNLQSIGNDNVEAMWEDYSGIVWLATFGGGLCKWNPRVEYFQHFKAVPGVENTLSNNVITDFAEDEAGMIWIATERGLNRFNPRTKEITPYVQSRASADKRSFFEIGCLAVKNDHQLWVGSREGLFVFDQKTSAFTLWQNSPKGEDIDGIALLYQSARGKLWLSTNRGELYCFDQQTNAFKLIRFLEGIYINAILEREDGLLWLGTATNGLLLYDPQRDALLYPFSLDERQEEGLPDFNIMAVHQAMDGQLWIGTSKGLCQVQMGQHPEDSLSIQYFDDQNGSDVPTVLGLLEDSKGNFWMSHKRGIKMLNRKTGEWYGYDYLDGLQEQDFIGQAFLKSRTGAFYFGGGDGFNLFFPDQIKRDEYRPSVRFTDLQVFNQSVRPGGEGSPLSVDISQAKHITLPYMAKVFTLEFSAMHFAAPSKNQYAFRMNGFNENWQMVGNQATATYTNLQPGKYLFEVKAANKDGYWSEGPEELQLTILPPWWATWWAYLSYFLLIYAMAYVIYTFMKRRLTLKNQLRTEQGEAIRLKELDQFKSRLYTNLTHEFRTPLTVILGMTDQIGANPKAHLHEGLQLIRRNGQNLLRLINQLLDLSKLDNHSFKLRLQQGDIIPYLRYVTQSFQTYANGQNLSLRFFTTMESLIMDYDSEQIKQVLTNLISNAIKFTPEGGDVRVHVAIKDEEQEQQCLLITVQDTGIGISEANLRHIFDRFYQVDSSTTREGEGTGIGLAHTQELVKLMEGKITVQSQKNKGSLFSVSLPIRRKAKLLEATTDQEQQKRDRILPNISLPPKVAAHIPTGSASAKGNLPQLLIIEDNPDVVIYLKSFLAKSYQLDIAYNGAIGVEKALEKIPDLIISDVMMPEKNGYELCDILKNDERTSHIPIILLTAKADHGSKISGLKTGADAYLSKPFDKREILIRLEMLVKKQKQLSGFFSKKYQRGFVVNEVPGSTEEPLPIEDAFIKKVRQIVEENYADEDFALPQLCQKVRMSRSQLYRKMQALIETAPSDFIRLYRLEKAKILLETTQLTASEVAWQVGYKDLAHFSKSFQNAFGFPPSATDR